METHFIQNIVIKIFHLPGYLSTNLFLHHLDSSYKPKKKNRQQQKNRKTLHYVCYILIPTSIKSVGLGYTEQIASAISRLLNLN